METYQTLIQAETLASLLASNSPDIVILDCRYNLTNLNYGYQSYIQGHISQAQFISLEKDLAGLPNGKNGRHPLPDEENLTKKLAKLGIGNHTQVIVYDDNTAMSPRLWWLLRHLGHYKVAVLDGGISRWRKLDLPLTTQTHEVKPKQFVTKSRTDDYVTATDILQELGKPAQLIIDARSPDRFKGENETLDPVGGHIPGAINHFFMDNLSQNGMFKNAAELAGIFNKLGAFDPRKRIISQCGSGVTACNNLLAMEIAGINGALLYPGSWSEWCSEPSRPVSQGHF